MNMDGSCLAKTVSQLFCHSQLNILMGNFVKNLGFLSGMTFENLRKLCVR